MANLVKRRMALAGISVASKDVNSMELWEEYQKTSAYRKEKEKKEIRRKEIIAKMKKSGTVDYDKAYKEAYYNNSFKYKPRLRVG